MFSDVINGFVCIAIYDLVDFATADQGKWLNTGIDWYVYKFGGD